ncbi:MAG: GxxExxY protein [Bacteroidota bacterium]
MLESFYEEALCCELEARGISVQTQLPVKASYKGRSIGIGFRLDILADDQVIIEIKSVDRLHDVHKKQLLTYLKVMRKKVGILINFDVARIEDKISLVRIIN